MLCERTALLPVGPDKAFALITQPERLRRWQVVAARIDLRAGGEYRWTIVPGAVAVGTVREVEPGRRLVLDFGWEGSEDLPPGASLVTITVEPQGAGTLVHLVHDGLTEEQAASHLAGWTHFLGRLEKAAANGDAGSDDNWEAPEKLDPIVAADATLAVLQHVLYALEAEDLSSPTPCTELTVSQLVDHLVVSLGQLGAMAGATTQPLSSGTPEERVAHVGQQVTEAWQRRGLDGTVPLGDGEVPAAFAASILPLELLLHAWDLAKATGRPLPVSDAVAAYALELAQSVITPETRAGGSFGPEVAAPTGADALARLVAFSGRAA